MIIALAGLGFVVVKALGGETIPFPKGTRIDIPAGEKIVLNSSRSNDKETISNTCCITNELARQTQPYYKPVEQKTKTRGDGMLWDNKSGG